MLVLALINNGNMEKDVLHIARTDIMETMRVDFAFNQPVALLVIMRRTIQKRVLYNVMVLLLIQA